MNWTRPDRRRLLQGAGFMGAVTLVGVGREFSAAASETLDERRSRRALRWSDPAAWPDGRVPGPGDVAQVRRAVVLTGKASVAGVEIAAGGSLSFDPDRTTALKTTGNVVVHGKLSLRPAKRSVRHKITFLGIDEAAYVGGGMEVLASDVGLWVVGRGQLDAVGSSKTGWNRAGTDPTWRKRDDIRVAPQSVDDFTGFRSFSPGRKVPTVKSRGVRHATEVFNLTRNVIIQGTPRGRAHVMFLMTRRPQTLEHVAFRHMGPRQFDAAEGKTRLVSGRYALHFHHCGGGSRGSAVKGVVVQACGTRAFVPHASHGVTFQDCIAFDVAEHGYWWDPDHDTYPAQASHDITYDRCAAFKIGRPSDGAVDHTISGFHLGQGKGNKCVDSVAVGVGATGGVQASGFNWPESANSEPNSWKFRRCVAHNNQMNGIFTWQNDPFEVSTHVLKKFTAYRNGNSGIDHGAYVNTFAYRDADLFENGNAQTSLAQLIIHTSGRNKFSRLRLHAGKRSDYAVAVVNHAAPGRVPTVIKNVELRGFRRRAVLIQERTLPGKFDFVNVTLKGRRDLEPTDFDVRSMAAGSVFRVQRRDGKAFRLNADGSATRIAAFR